MTDIKKVTVTSVSTNEGGKKRPKKKRTVRLILTLSESNEKTCPEFNYGDLLSQHLYRRLGNHCLGDVINGPAREKGDPYASDEDEALKALARSFEKKYGGGVAGGPKRKKRKRENDFKQLGEGYDDTDPFIDNSDAIDDVLPTNVETKLGGFYINSGELNFEEVQISEDEKTNDSQVQNLKRKRKNEIVSSEEEGEQEEEDEQMEIEDNEGDVIGEDDGAKVRENGILKIKKRKLDEGEMLRKRKKMIDKFNAKKQKKKGKSENEIEAKTDEVVVPDEQNEPKVNSDGTSIAASIEAVVAKARESTNMQEEVPVEDINNRKEKDDEEEEEEEGEVEEREDSSSESSSSSSSSESSSSESESEDEKEDKESEKETEKKEDEEVVENEEACVSNDNDNDHLNNASDDNEKDSVLPADLPQDLVAVLDKLKEVGKNTKASSQKFFTDAVNKMLLSIEIKLCKYGGRKKNLIYNHLSQHLPCGTQTLLKRAKHLLVEKLDERLKIPTQRLKEALEKAMPKLLEAHALECQKIAEDKGEEHEDGDEEDDASESSKKSKLPRKKFEFTPELRALLCDVVKIRCQGWHMVKKRSETAEEHVKSFIDSHLKTFWPKGWVTTKFLYKESQSAHSLITAKNSMKLAMPKKVTVLGGGIVSNANMISAKMVTDTAVTSTNTENDDDKAKVPSKDADKNLNSTLHSTAEQSQELKTKLTASSHDRSDARDSSPGNSTLKIGDNTPTCDPESKDKSPASQLVKLPSSKVLDTTPPKDLTKSSNDNPLSSISPISESSQKSFHGFESPNKAADAHKGVDEISPRQSLFDSTKKPFKNSFDSSLESLPPVREGKPPKPSLTATALPKISIASSISINKGDDLKKGFGDHLDVPKSTKDDRKTITCITIKSVEKINEAVSGSTKNYKERERTKNFESKDKESSKEIPRRDEALRIIDLATGNESGQVKEGPGKLQNTSAAASARNVSVISSKVVSRSVNNESLPDHTGETHAKNDKLEQEMDQVMNAILHISKKNIKTSECDGIGNKLSLPAGHPTTSYSAEKQSLVINQSQQQRKVSTIHSPQSNVTKKSSGSYDISKTSSVVVNPPKSITYSSDAADAKNYHKPNFLQQSQKIPDIITSKHQSSHSNISHFSSAHNAYRASPSVSLPNTLQHISHQSNSNAKIVEDSSTYQSSQNSSHSKPKQEFYNRAMLSGQLTPSNNIERISDDNMAHRPAYRNSNQLTTMPSETKSSYNSSNTLLHVGRDRSSSAGPLDLHKPSAPSSNIITSSSSTGGNYNSISAVGGNNRTSVSSYNGNHKTPMMSPSGSHQSFVPISSENQQVAVAAYIGNRKISPSMHSELRTSSHNESHRTSSTPKKSHQGESHKISSGHENRQLSSSVYGESHRISPSIPSGSHRASPSTQTESHRKSPSSHSGSHRTSPSIHSGSHRTSPSAHSGSHRTSPSIHSGGSSSSCRASPSAYSGSHRTSPSNLSGSHRISPSRSRESSQTSSHPGLHRPSSPHRTSPMIMSGSQSQSKSHSMGHRLPSSHNGNQGSLLAFQGGSSSLHPTPRNNDSNLSPENLSTDAKDYGITSISGSRSLHIKHSVASHASNQGASLSTARSSRPIPDMNPSSYTHQGVPHRQSKPSHNIDGLLYHNSSSKNTTAVNLSQPNYSHSVAQSTTQKSQVKLSHVDSSWNLESGTLSSSKSSSEPKQKSTESSSYSASGSPSSHRSSISSVQPKVKQRSDSFPLSVSHPLLGNITQEQQDLWQQMNAGGYLSRIPPGEVYKYMSQQGLYQNTNTSEGSSKKSSQI